MWRLLELGVCKQRVKNAEVGVAEGGGIRREVEEITDHNIHKDVEIVGIEVFVGRVGCEEEIEQLKD